MSSATVAQLVEQTIRNRPVKGSIPFGGFFIMYKLLKYYKDILVFFKLDAFLDIFL